MDIKEDWLIVCISFLIRKVNINEVLVQELHKPMVKNSEKEKYTQSFRQHLAEMESLSSNNHQGCQIFIMCNGCFHQICMS